MRKVFVCAVLLVFAAGTYVSAGPIVAPRSGGWEYTFTNPTIVDPTWNTTTGTLGWLTGAAPFGNYTSSGLGDPYDPAGYFNYATYWGADGSDGDDLWVRRAVDFTGFDLASIRWDLGVDNGFKLYANGVLISSVNGEGYTSRWEYSGAFAAALNPGVNVIAVALEDHGGLTAWDMQVTGTPVPDPGSSLLLLAMGLAGLRACRKRSQ